MNRIRRIPQLIATAIGVLVLLLWGAGWLQWMENDIADLRFVFRGEVAPSPDVVIVAFDEASFKHMGRWPWSRQHHAKMIERLTDAGAKAILFDVTFPEPETDRPSADKAFVKAAQRSGRVVIGSFFQNDALGQVESFLLPHPLFRESVATGFTNVFPELDGVSRKLPLIRSYEGRNVPSLALAGLAIALQKPPEQVLAESGVTLDEYGEMIINYAGGYESFPYYSYHDVLTGKVPAESFAGKIVLLGGTASGLYDFVATPFAPTYPGVEAHANALSNVLLGNPLRLWSPWLTFLFILGFAALPVAALQRFSPFKGGMAVLAVLAAYFVMTYLLFSGKQVLADTAAPLASLVLSSCGVLFYRFMAEEQEKRRIKRTFGHYLSPRVMEKILTDPTYLQLGGQRQTLTVLFSDIRNFTTMSESMDSGAVVNLLNEYLSKMVEVVFRHDGTLDKFIGDAVMAFWGAPIPQDDHARRAVLCSLDMIEELEKLKVKWASEGKRTFDIGIGINTGEMTVGNMGSKDKMEYTVIGDNVNLGSRLEGLNKEFGTRIIIADSTYQLTKDLIEAKHIGAVKVKGKTRSVEVYSISGRKIAAGEQSPAFDPEKRIDMPGQFQQPQA